MDAQAQTYQYLWDGTEPQWALLNVGAIGAAARYLIVDTNSKVAKIIENDADAKQVIQMMLDAGVRVVTPGNGF